ncbi:MAG: LPS assembly lipoprotein LptE [Pseudomonadota bacterium]|nr:LPS assembly lipoprotein LptE [Pseudomonadota bacterium]
MKNLPKKIQVIFLSCIISACGFTLRGELNLPDDVKTIALVTEGYSPTSSEINLLLTGFGVETSSRKIPDSFLIRIIAERHDRRQLTLSQAGRVNEYELIFKLTYEIDTPLGDKERDRIVLYRDYSFDESRILGTSDREEEIRKEMEATAASIIVNKLKARIESM